jgi:hypothetical protein
VDVDKSDPLRRHVAGGGRDPQLIAIAKVAARRSRPASARVLSGQVSDLAIRSPASSARAPRKSDAVPVHSVREVMSEHTGAATASARLPQYEVRKVTSVQNRGLQAVDHRAKSAMRAGDQGEQSATHHGIR